MVASDCAHETRLFYIHDEMMSRYEEVVRKTEMNQLSNIPQIISSS